MPDAEINIPLPDAQVMPFVQPFIDTSTCKDHIDHNDEKKITLFTYAENMNRLILDSYFENRRQLQKILIFCPSIEDQNFWSAWAERFRHKIEEPFLCDELNLKLLLFGREHTRKVYKDFHENNGSVVNKVKEDERNIMQALATYFQQKVDEEDKKIELSLEAQQ